MKSLFDTASLLALVALVGCGTDANGPASDGAAPAEDSSVADGSEGSTGEASAIDAGTEDSGGEGAEDRDAARDAVADRTVGDAAPAGDATGVADAVGGGDARDAAQGAACLHVSDCRIVSFECTGCDCLALGTADPDPVCHGNPFQCFADPCQGHSAACDNGHCAVH
jgi:hypothetical protein